jgi:hypothetical protein
MDRNSFTFNFYIQLSSDSTNTLLSFLFIYFFLSFFLSFCLCRPDNSGLRRELNPYTPTI